MAKSKFDALNSSDFQEVYAYYDEQITRTYGEEQVELLDNLAKKIAAQPEEITAIAQSEPELLRQMVERQELGSDLINLAAEIAASNGEEPTDPLHQTLDMLVGERRADEDVLKDTVIPFFEKNAIQRIGTEHPTEPYQFMRVIVRETKARLADSYRRHGASDEALANAVHKSLVLAENEIRSIQEQHPDNTNVREMCQKVLTYTYTHTTTNSVTSQNIHKALPEIDQELTEFMRSLDVSGAQKRTTHSENIRNNKFLSQDLHNLLEMRLEIHNRLKTTAPAAYAKDHALLDQMEMMRDGTWDGDADGKPAVTGASTRESAIGQSTHRLKELKHYVTGSLLPAIDTLSKQNPENKAQYDALYHAVHAEILGTVQQHLKEVAVNPHYDFRSEIIEATQKVQEEFRGLIDNTPALQEQFGQIDFINHNFLRTRIFARQNSSVDQANMNAILADSEVQTALGTYRAIDPEYARLLDNVRTRPEGQKPLDALTEHDKVAFLDRMTLLVANEHVEGTPEYLAKEQLQARIRELEKTNPTLATECERNRVLASGAYTDKKTGEQRNVYETMIADTEHASDALTRLFFVSNEGGYGKLPIIRLRESVPAFERNARKLTNPKSTQDLGIAEPLYTSASYRGHLAKLGNRETDMFAESDTPKHYGDTSRAAIVRAQQKGIRLAANHGITQEIKDGRGDNNPFRSGGISDTPFYTVQGRAKLFARKGDFIAETGRIERRIAEQQQGEQLVLKNPLHREIAYKDSKLFYRAATAAYAEGRDLEEGLGKRREAWLGFGTGFEEQKSINMSARKERGEKSSIASGNTHRYDAYLGTPKPFKSVPQETTRAISDDDGNKSSRSEANKTDNSLMKALSGFRARVRDEGGTNHIADERITRMIYGNEQIAHAFFIDAYGQAFRDPAIEWQFFPAANRPANEAQKQEWAARVRTRPVVEGTPTIQHAAELVALRQVEAEQHRQELLRILVKALPTKAGERFDTETLGAIEAGNYSPKNEDFTFIFPKEAGKQMQAQLEVLSSISPLQAWLHLSRQEGRGLDSQLPKDWVDMSSISSGNKDKITEFLDRMQIAYQNAVEAPAAMRCRPMMGVELDAGKKAELMERATIQKTAQLAQVAAL